MSCMCPYCIRNRDLKKGGIPDDIIDYILDLEMSVEYYKVIFDGKWPTGKEVLTKALLKYEEQ